MKSNKKKISAIIIAKDEEKKISDCLKSIAWVDEIILVDTGSTDETIKTAEKYGASVVGYRGGSYSDWRNKGLKEAAGNWILYVDADERVTPELRKEISQLTNQPIGQYKAYAISRRNIILGREMKYGGWWPDYVKRLYVRRNLARWTGELHEEPVIRGKMGHLVNPLIHEKHSALSEMVDKTNAWSEVEAKLMFGAGHPPMNVTRFCSAIMREFWKRMIRYRAFMDGTEGMIYAIYQVYSRFISYAKLWEMQIKSSKGDKFL